MIPRRPGTVSSTPRTLSLPAVLVAGLFFVSGLSSLVLETVWLRLMVLVFGSTNFALSTVLTAFMAGLALGGWAGGHLGGRLKQARSALLLYGGLELGIGLFALLLPQLAPHVQWAHAAMLGLGHGSPLTVALTRFALASLLLLVPTVAMGATLPVLARFICDGLAAPQMGARVGGLYAVNTAGAVLGVFLAGFVLLPVLGLWRTNLAACVADLLLALGALLLWRSLGAPRRRADRDAAVGPAVARLRPAAPCGPWPGRPLARLAAASIVVSGALAMAYQVAWNRALSLIIGSSTYAFSLILICFLLGLALGAALYSRRQAADPDQMSNLAVIHLLVAAGGFGGLLVMDWLPPLMVLLLRGVSLQAQQVFIIKLVVAAAVVLLPTVFMGMVFPAVVRIHSGERARAARSTGAVYAANTLGGIVGSFAAGFVLIPLLGLQRTLLVLVFAGLALAVVVGQASPRGRSRRLLAVTPLALALAALALARPWSLDRITSGVFRLSRYADLLHPGEGAGAAIPRDERLERQARARIPPALVVDTMQEPSVGSAILFHREGIATTVTISRSVDQSLSTRACWVRTALLVNGKPDASLAVLHARPTTTGCAGLLRTPPGRGLRMAPTGDAETQILSGLLPVLLFPEQREPRSALVVGWGSGITVGALLQGGLERVVAVELEPQVVAAARSFEPYNHRPQHDPRVRLIVDDGRNVLAVSERRYDLVVSEPSNPWISGCGNLFTREFFQLVRRRLAPDGVFLQWLQAYEMSPRNVLSVLGTLQDVFPEVYLFRPAGAPSDLLIVARRAATPPSWPALQRRLRRGPLRRELARVAVQQPADIAARLLADPSWIRQQTVGIPRNTDDNARIEFAAPRDLINYARYSTAAVTGQLTRPPAMRHPVWREPPADYGRRLCRGLLRAGRSAAAMALSTEGLGRCQHRARLLRTPARHGGAASRGVLLQRIAKALRHGGMPVGAGMPVAHRATGQEIGRWYARAGEPYLALVYLLGQRPLDPVSRHALGRVLYERGYHLQAIGVLEPAIDGVR